MFIVIIYRFFFVSFLMFYNFVCLIIYNNFVEESVLFNFIYYFWGKYLNLDSMINLVILY